MKTLYILLFSLIILISANGQQVIGTCGMSMEDQAMMTNRLLENIKASQDLIYTRNAEPKYVPVRVHIVSNAAGSGGINKKSILRWLCKLNTNYKDVGLQFYLKDQYDEFNNDNVFNNPMLPASKTVMNGKKDRNALNLYITGSSGEVGVLGFYDPQYDWVVLPKSEINDVTHTGSHEFGHFFSLRHTFYGWEGCQWTLACCGNPVDITTVPCSGEKIELVNQSNCTIAADLICDTPPDYNFGYGWSNCVPFSRNVKDFNGDLIDPMENNYMSYFFDCGDYIFTIQQIAVMNADYNSTRRNYLRTSFTPSATTIGSNFSPIGPLDGITVDSRLPITISWEPVEGATKYYLEYSWSNLFIDSKTDLVESNTNSYTIPENILRNAIYYYRITPFNEYATCTNTLTSSRATFVSSNSVAVKEINGIASWQVIPSILDGRSDINIEINATESQSVSIYFTNTLGQSVLSPVNELISNGLNQLQMKLENITKGVYFISIKGKGGVSTKKIIVL